MFSSKVFNYTAIQAQFLLPSLPRSFHIQVDFDLRLFPLSFSALISLDNLHHL